MAARMNGHRPRGTAAAGSQFVEINSTVWQSRERSSLWGGREYVYCFASPPIDELRVACDFLRTFRLGIRDQPS
eukprot:SAG11_NODE_2545_length_3234_cov_4.296332_4_plen_74_part_00